MSTLSTLVSAVNTESAPPYIISEYEMDGVGADTTSLELISLELPARTRANTTYRNVPNTTTSGEAYAIKLTGFSISCLSTNFDISILNKDDISLINTTNEFMKYTGINLSESDQDFQNFVIRNRDAVLTNEIYVYFNNHSNTAMGTVRIELIYIPVHDNEDF